MDNSFDNGQATDTCSTLQLLVSCRVLVSRYTDSYVDVQVGRAQIDSIELRYCGQG